MYDIENYDRDSETFKKCWLTETWHPNEDMLLDIHPLEHRYIFKDVVLRYVELVGKDCDFSIDDKYDYLLTLLTQKF